MVPPGSPPLAACASSNLRLVVPGRASPLARLHRGPVCPQGQGGARTCSAVERLEADKAKYVKSLQVITRRQEPALRSRSPRLSPGAQRALGRQQRHELCRSPVLLRTGGSHVLSPESLIIHRQKRDTEDTEGPRRDNRPSSSPARGQGEGPPVPRSPEPSVPWVPTGEEDAGAPGGSSGGGSGGTVPLPPGKPALALRVSLPLSEQERFFNCCGLERAVVELLGRERFVPAAWDNGRAVLHGSCESEPEKASGGSDGEVGPGEEEEEEEGDARMGSAVSVVERNARIIKWLYDCQRAGVAAQEPPV